MEQLDQQDVSVLDEDVVMKDSHVDAAPSADEVGAGTPHVEAAAQQVLASSSSTVEPPSLDASSVVPAPEPAEPASGSRLVGPKVHQTPFQHLEGLLPSRDFSILLDENAWRFRVECKVKGQVFEAPYGNKTFSKAFGTALTWEDVKECHSYMWKKWALIENKSPNLSSERQEPGDVKQATLDGLKPLMSKLSPKKDYARLR